MADKKRRTAIDKSELGWKSALSGLNAGLILYGFVSGLVIYLATFSQFSQFTVILHTVVGLVSLLPIALYSWKHWRIRRGGTLNHYQLLGYTALLFLALCLITGVILTWQSLFHTKISYLQSSLHWISGVLVGIFLLIHLSTILFRKMKQGSTLLKLRKSQTRFSIWTFGLSGILLLATFVISQNHQQPKKYLPFAVDYNWRFGEQTPFAPSLASLDINTSNGPPMAANPEYLTGSESCGSSGCHQNIYNEWLPSAHRYSSMDDMFQKVQTIMAEETSAEHTRYCAGCHDPVSLLSGAKNSGNITLSSAGYEEGASCVVCHSISKTDVQGNGDYRISIQDRYIYELNEDGMSKFVSDFLIRSYPSHHVNSYSRPLYKTEEYCAACHKQYIDKQVNTDIGKVQGQNQYDSWKNSRWNHEDDPEQTISCRECHMPLLATADPANGDTSDSYRHQQDNKHRSHRTLASNLYIPALMKLENAEEHIKLTESWLQGNYEIPEIANKWVSGPVVKLEILAPEKVTAGENIKLGLSLVNNKTGHDFPTGPLDMIESWVELIVTDSDNNLVYRTGNLDENDKVVGGAHFRADGFDRKGKLIDKHNLWDLVGASYKRSLYPGRKDLVSYSFQCPSMGRGRVIANQKGVEVGKRLDDVAIPAIINNGNKQLKVTAKLWYRKANPEFLNATYGIGHKMKSPATLMTQESILIEVLPDE